jgi:hypothetical protein
MENYSSSDAPAYEAIILILFLLSPPIIPAPGTGGGCRARSGAGAVGRESHSTNFAQVRQQGSGCRRIR